MKKENKNKGKNKKANDINLEELLEKKGLLTRESVLADIAENENVKQIGRIILAAVCVSGVLAISAAAPALPAALVKLSKFFRSGVKKKMSQAQRQRMMKTIYNLRRNKLIEYGEQGDKIILRMTVRGHSVFIKQRLFALKIKRQKKWDRIWRVVIFDIPNKLSTRRDALRARLKNMGFFQFQKSAFIAPYPCRQELEVILEYYNIFDYVTYLEASQVSGEEKCRRYFNL